jgi:hypothetical protein
MVKIVDFVTESICIGLQMTAFVIGAIGVFAICALPLPDHPWGAVPVGLFCFSVGWQAYRRISHTYGKDS